MRIRDGGDPINRDLFGRWPLEDNAAGAAYDIGPRQLHFNRANAVSATMGAAYCSSGAGKSFSSATDYFSRAASFPASSPISISMWINASNVNGAVYGFGNNTTTNRMCLEFETGNLHFDNPYSVSNGRITASWTSYFGRWVRAAFVYDVQNSRKSIWVNGVRVATGTTLGAPPPSPGTPLTLGAWGGFAGRGTYQVADFAIWSRALRDIEIIRLYQDPWAGTQRKARIVANSNTPTFSPIVMGLF